MSGKALPGIGSFAVVMGLSPTGLHVVRCLGRQGIRVVGVAEGVQAGGASRFVSSVIREKDPIRRLEAICALAPETAPDAIGRPVLIPTSDQDVDFVIAHASRLGRHFAFQDSYRNGLAAQIMSKDSFYALCERHGVAFPKLVETTADGLLALAPDLTFPVMVKPARIHAIKDRMAGQKGWILRDRAELEASLRDIPQGAGTLLVQEIVPGPESAITLVCLYLDRQGRPRRTFTARKLRQYPPGFGSASLVQSAPDAEGAAATTAFLADLGYHGIAAAEFKRHPQHGKAVIIEINVRPSLWFGVTEAAGCPVVLSAYRELAGLEDAADGAQLDGVRWRYAVKDMVSARFYRRNPGFLLPPPDIDVVGAARHRVGAVFSLDDPLPVLAEWLNFAIKAVSRIAGRLRPGQGRAAE